MKKGIKKVLCLGLLSSGLIYGGTTIDFLGEQFKKGAELAHETVVKGSEAVSKDISSGLETARKGAETVAQGVASSAEAVRETAARGAEFVGKTAEEGARVAGDIAAKGVDVVYQTAKPVVDVAAEGARVVGETVVSGAQAVGDLVLQGAESTATVVREGAEKTGEIISGGVRIVYEGTKQGAEFVADITRPVTDTAIAASKAFADAVANALRGGFEAIRSGAEFVGGSVSEGGKSIIRGTGKSIQFVGEQIKQAGVLVEEGVERMPEELAKLWNNAQILIEHAAKEGFRRAKEVPKLLTGAAAVLIKNDLPQNIIIKTPSGDWVKLKTHEEVFAGAQMRVVFVKDQSAFVIYDETKKELCTLHTGFNGDLLWVNVSTPDMPENVRAYVGGHNGEATYRISPDIKVKIHWWLNSSKYLLHDFYFELLPA